MNKEIKERWVAALRSGEYTQGRGQLRTKSTAGGPDRFCCLGVLCELAVADGVIPPAKQEFIDEYAYGKDRQTGLLPSEVMGWADISRRGSFGDGHFGTALVYANDDGASFDQLADIIEEHF